MNLKLLMFLVALFAAQHMASQRTDRDIQDPKLASVRTVYAPRMRHSRHSENVPAVEDNHKPIFTECSNYHPVMKEEEPIGTYVFTVQAKDMDPPEMGGKITYKFISTSGEKERFHVDPDTGVITTADMFDHDEPSHEKEVYITVRATDNGQPQLDDACTIKIKIEDINDNAPVFDKVTYIESVPQDLPVGRSVMRISATDIDEGQNSVVQYELVPTSPDQQYFTVDKDNGLIYLNKTIDKPPGYKFYLSAVVKDSGQPSLQSSMSLDITVVESNKKAPSFTEIPKAPIRIKENYSDFNKPIATLKAESNIRSELKLQFELVSGQTEQTNKFNTFVLDNEGHTAYLKLGNHLDYEKINEYILTVRVWNNYELAAETIINVEVEDVNDNIPVFSEIRTGTVLENEPVGTPVMQVRAFDADGTSANNQITYELGDPMDPFAIDPVTGLITTREVFDREERRFYNIQVLATDNAESTLIPGRNNTAKNVCKIEIADKNDNPPHFGQDTYVAAEVAESANINELVTQIQAQDVDTASTVTYSIIAGNTGDAFMITNHTGEIRVKNSLDYEKITSYSLDVRASDGMHEDFAKVLITILNINDNPPVFLANYTKTIEEEKKYDGCIVKVEAYDPDIKDRSAPQLIVYSLVKHEQKKFLTIDNTGCLRLTKPLDRDPPFGFASWQVLIMAADQEGKLGSESLRSTTEVILELTDINDNAPFLTNPQPVIFYENEPPGPIVNLTAQDHDSLENGPPFIFALSEVSHDIYFRNKFSIHGSVLSSVVSFDREKQKSYKIPISITDSGTPRMTGTSTLHLIIGDRNDNPMESGHSTVFVYSLKGEYPDTEVGRVYVKDPDDWDTTDKKFSWLPSYEDRSPYFDINSDTGVVIMKQGTPAGVYTLTFNVTEQSRNVPFHSVTATVTLTVKDITEEVVDKSGSIRFVGITDEQFIIPEHDGLSKKDKLHRLMAKQFNTSLDNVDIFTVMQKITVKDMFLDVRFSAHGSPYYAPEKLNAMVSGIQDKIEEELGAKIYMVNIDECIHERVQCEASCRNVLIKSNMPAAVFTNTTSFIGINARVDTECVCLVQETQCMNGGTPFGDKCECPEGLTGPQCQQTSVGFHGNSWAMYPAFPACSEGRISMNLISHSTDGSVLYWGPLKYNPLLPLQDFLSLELNKGYAVLLINFGNGTTRLNNSVVYVPDGKPHAIDIVYTKQSVELQVDNCQSSACMALSPPVGTDQILNVNSPIQLGGVHGVNLSELGRMLNWTDIPRGLPLVGCISNFTFNDKAHWNKTVDPPPKTVTYNLGQPGYSKNADPSCQLSMFTAVTFGIDTRFLVAIIACIAILIALLLLVVVHKKRNDGWAEKEVDDIRENIIPYEDEGGGEGDVGYDLHVLRQMYQPPPEVDPYLRGAALVNDPAPDLSGVLDDRKSELDRHPGLFPLDNVRRYAYEGDGNSSGSLSSLASCTDDTDLKFNYLSTFGPRFRKLADMYGDSDDERSGPHEESWC